MPVLKNTKRAVMYLTQQRLFAILGDLMAISSKLKPNKGSADAALMAGVD
jgi:hypothetical protein